MKGENSIYRPKAGTICLISGENMDDEDGYVFGEFEILWRNDIHVLYGNNDCWPNLSKWEHIIAKPREEQGVTIKFVLPGTVVSAIRQFLRFGDETKDEAHNGHYSKGGWPHNILSTFLKKHEKEKVHEVIQLDRYPSEPRSPARPKNDFPVA